MYYQHPLQVPVPFHANSYKILFWWQNGIFDLDKLFLKFISEQQLMFCVLLFLLFSSTVSNYGVYLCIKSNLLNSGMFCINARFRVYNIITKWDEKKLLMF